jgi:hypothetical protein
MGFKRRIILVQLTLLLFHSRRAHPIRTEFMIKAVQRAAYVEIHDKFTEVCNIMFMKLEFL